MINPVPSIAERPKRDVTWYAQEAERLRGKAAATKDDGALRNSYLALAREYQELAATLQKHTAGDGTGSSSS